MKRSKFLAVFIFTLILIWLAGAAAAQDCGDVDLDASINLLDATFLINYLYKSGMPPAYPHLADVDSSGTLNILDVSYLISYLYKNGPDPSCPNSLDNPMGWVTYFTDCKLFTEGQSAVMTSNDSTCIEYSYDGEGTLQLRHVNAGFNCCPGQIVAAVSVEDNVITIVEAENYDSFGPCECLCLFDVDMEVLYLPPGEYTITVEELYLVPEDDPLEFTVDLSAPATGSHCVYRHSYPWGFDTFASGEITNTSDCKTFPTAKPADLVTPDIDCMEYSYDGQNILQFRHVNAGFNCCPIIGAQITVDSNVITIAESETFDEYGACLCLCLFDVDYEITGIGPGEYVVVVEELYLEPGDESLVFNIVLTTTPTGSYCVERDHYPWGEMGGPSGGMTGHSDCKVMALDKGTLDEDCIVYEYDGSGLLTLQHINDIFNCCVDSLYAGISIDLDSNIILIEEYEAASMPCDCICIYDLDYEVANLPPGEYTIRVDNVDYYDEYNGGIIEFTVDLVASPSGFYCVDRPYLPWMGK